MSHRVHALAALLLAIPTALGWAAVASAHPLGNYTVNRAVILRLGVDALQLRYVVDMAEIPAFGELQLIDTDGDGLVSAAEGAAYASSACLADRRALQLQMDGRPVDLTQHGTPELSFPAGAGGLQTLRLVCAFGATLPSRDGPRSVEVTDTTDDGHIGWHEVIIAADLGVSITSSDVPSQSGSAELTRYPVDQLQTPPNVRSGSASFRSAAGSAGSGTTADPRAPTLRSTANDPLAALVGGQLTPVVALLAILLAVGLGAAHAVSPGHGKTLVAAYLIGSSGSRRQAATLGLTVAVTHTAGVFLLGAVTLLAGQFLVPERVIGWLSIGSGFLVVMLGAGLVLQAVRSAGHTAQHGHGPGQQHDHSPPHGHSHQVASSHGHAPELRARNVVALGLAGGMVPSASALIVLLVAITTGRLLFGLLLIVGFGIGMALVLGGLAVATTIVRGAVGVPGGIMSRPFVRRAARAVPLVSGLAVLAAGFAVTIGALTRVV